MPSLDTDSIGLNEILLVQQVFNFCLIQVNSSVIFHQRFWFTAHDLLFRQTPRHLNERSWLLCIGVNARFRTREMTGKKSRVMVVVEKRVAMQNPLDRTL
jgi:hypothetical protein